MIIRIVQDDKIDVLDVIRRSAHAKAPDAERSLASYMLASAEVWCGYADEEVACVCGLIAPTMLSDRAYLWLITTSLVDEHPFLFIRHSQLWMDVIRKRYALISGDVDIDNPRAQQWLRWLGADLGWPVDKKIPFQIRPKAA
jgi:hypothetical protein